MQKLKPSCWPEVRGGFSGRGWSPELHAAAQAVATFLGPRLPALQRLSLQSREPGAWNGLTPSAHVSLFPSGVCVRLGLLSQENPCGLLLAFPLSSLYSASFLCPHCQLCSLLSRKMQFPRNGFLCPIHHNAVFLCLSLPVALPF